MQKLTNNHYGGTYVQKLNPRERKPQWQIFFFTS